MSQPAMENLPTEQSHADNRTWKEEVLREK